MSNKNLWLATLVVLVAWALFAAWFELIDKPAESKAIETCVRLATDEQGMDRGKYAECMEGLGRPID